MPPAKTLVRRVVAGLPRQYLAVGIRTGSGRTWWIPIPLFLLEELAGIAAFAGRWLIVRHPRLRRTRAGQVVARILPGLPRYIRMFRAQPPMVLVDVRGADGEGRTGLRVVLI